MELLLERRVFNENSTEGVLYVNGKHFCFVIEDRVRAEPGQWKPELKIYGKTAIPYGRYPVLVTWSNRFQRMLTQILNVPNFSGIRIHNGTSEVSSAGCPIVSYKEDFKKDRLINDKEAMNDLCKMIEDAQKKEKIWINIIKASDVTV